MNESKIVYYKLFDDSNRGDFSPDGEGDVMLVSELIELHANGTTRKLTRAEYERIKNDYPVESRYEYV